MGCCSAVKAFSPGSKTDLDIYCTLVYITTTRTAAHLLSALLQFGSTLPEASAMVPRALSNRPDLLILPKSPRRVPQFAQQSSASSVSSAPSRSNPQH